MRLKKNEILVWKRCKKDNISNNDFKYPKKGWVEAPDWNDRKVCGGGLHGWTLGFETYFDKSLEGNLVLLKVNKNDGYVELDDKVKFRKGYVVLNTPSIEKAHQAILDVYLTVKLHWSTANQGKESTANQGSGSTANQGYKSTANQGHDSTANQRSGSTANQGYRSTANQGYKSTANQGKESTANQRYWSTANQGNESTANQGNESTANQGYWSTANQGKESTANQGSGSTANQGYWSTANQGKESTANQGSGSTANQGNESTANQGNESTANQGKESTANQGKESTANQGKESTANQGKESTANQGSGSTANQGYKSTANQGHDSTANQRSGSTANQGYRSTANQGYKSTANQGHDSTANQGNESVSVHRFTTGRTSIVRFAKNSVAVLYDDSGKPHIYSKYQDKVVYFFDSKPHTVYTHTPDSISKLQKHEVFVFGSNKAGNHMGGAAKLAVKKFGAEIGTGEGSSGQSYAIPTLDEEMKPVSLEDLEKSITRFVEHAYKETTKIFLVTKIGCGIAGFKEEQIKGLFKRLPGNVVMPKGWL